MDDPSEVPHFLPCLIHPKVVGLEVAVIGAIAAIVALTPRITLPVVVLIVLITVIGGLAIIRLVNQSHRLAMSKKTLALRLEEGLGLFDRTRLTGPPQVSQDDLRAWNDLTEKDIRKYVDESHVARFRFAGYLEVPNDFTTYRLQAKLNFLNELLEQLKD